MNGRQGGGPKAPCAWSGLAVSMLAVACRLASPALVAAEAQATLPPEQATTSRGTRNVMNFAVTWSAPDRVVVPMKIRNGLPTIPSSLNGRAVWLILDTGSQECVLEDATARAAGVRLVDSPLAHVEVAGVRGNEIAEVGVPDSVSIGSWHWHGNPWVVRTSHHPTTGLASLFGSSIEFNILGMSALRAMCTYLTVDSKRGEVTFGFKGGFQPADPAAASHQPFEIRHGIPYLNVSHGDQAWPFVLDTGASSKVEIVRAIAEEIPMVKPARWVRATQVGLGESEASGRTRIQCLTLESMTFLGRNWRNIEALVVESESKIGMGMWRSSRLTVDFSASQIWLENSDSAAQ